jgi:hypothetical protein
MLELTFSDRKGDGCISNDGKVQADAQGNHIAFSGNKYLIQRDHMVEVLQLEQELGPELASVLESELELELEPSLGQGQGLEQEPELVWALEPAQVLVRELEPSQGQGQELRQEPAQAQAQE